MRIIIGSRGSRLALWQARHIESKLRALGCETAIEVIRTTGDRITDVALSKVGSKGLFTKELEEALLDGRIHIAVHSLKDMPTDLPAGLSLAAIPEREDPRDAIVGCALESLALGARVGTSSLRRSAQLQALRPDLVIESVRGNLDTRIRKLDEGLYDAILLAAAGLKRLGWSHRIAQLLDTNLMCPAVGQGALAIETAVGTDAERLCAHIDHAPTRAAVTAERSLLASLGGGCQVPIGAHASFASGEIHLQALVAAPDGGELIRAHGTGPMVDPVKLGSAVADQLRERGASRILAGVG
jgi:hydroxymethylbilane synthase